MDGKPTVQQWPASAQHVPRDLQVGLHSQPDGAVPPHRPAHELVVGAVYVRVSVELIVAAGAIAGFVRYETVTTSLVKSVAGNPKSVVFSVSL